MRLLALTPRLPFPPLGGDKVRALELITRLAARHQVELVSFVESAADEASARELARRHPGMSVETVRLTPWQSRLNALSGLVSSVPLQVHYYRSARMRELVARKLAANRYDGVYVHLIRMAPYVEALAGTPRVLDMTDAVSMVFERAHRVRRDWLRPANAIEIRRLRRYETELVRRFERTTLVSEVDRDWLVANGAPAERLSLIYLGVDRTYFAPRATDWDPKRLVFVGNMRSFPNSDAALYLLREIFPRVRAEEKDACVDVVGVNPPPAVRAFSGTPGVTVTGPVDDVRPFVERGAVSLCPVRVAGGVQFKILEALALGVPVVTSPEGFEGLGSRGEEDGVVVARDAREFARASLELMRDRERRRELARRAQSFIAERYDWDRQVSALEALFLR